MLLYSGNFKSRNRIVYPAFLGEVSSLPQLTPGRYGLACAAQGSSLIASGGAVNSSAISLVQRLDLK
jgi:hypothetical protein